MTTEEKAIKANCPNCKGERNCFVRAEFERKITSQNDPTSATDTHYILECCGCNNCFVRREYWFSEWDQIDEDSYGRPVMIPGIEVSQWPAPSMRQMPEWTQVLARRDRTLHVLLDEMYSAVNNDLPILACIGVRTAFDRASELLQVDPKLSFFEKLNALETSGHIGKAERATLEVLTDAGSAAAHRGWHPKPEQVSTLFEIIEAFLHRTFVLGHGVERLKKAIPPKSPRKRQR